MAKFHEDFDPHRSLVAKAGSERSFGLVFAAFFLVIGVLPLLRHESPAWWLVGLSVAAWMLTFVAPVVFRYPNRLWFKLGNALSRVVGPLAIGIVFFLAVVPVGLLMRAIGKDPLRLRFDRNASSYWIRREPPGPDPKSMGNQF